MIHHSLLFNSSCSEGTEASRLIAEAASFRIRTFDLCTKLQQGEVRKIKELTADNLETCRLIGRGSFSTVYTVLLKEGQHYNDRLYALKRLKVRRTSMTDALTVGAVDFILEAKILSSLQHPNIIELHAISRGLLSESSSTQKGAYFLVLDLLTCTLDYRLKQWREQRSFISSLRGVSGQDMTNRIKTVVLGVARGMAYLHSNNIIFRDLKPANVGFDENGTVRIFDFGLAREYNGASCCNNTITEGSRHMTGECGTKR